MKIKSKKSVVNFKKADTTILKVRECISSYTIDLLFDETERKHFKMNFGYYPTVDILYKYISNYFILTDEQLFKIFTYFKNYLNLSKKKLIKPK